MTRYAAQTSVSSTKSRDEIERILVRYGADQFIYGWQDEKAIVGFRMNKRQVKFMLPLPDRKEFRYTPTTERYRSDEAVERAFEQAVRQRWRALALVIKAKLEAVETGITEFDDEFLAHIVLPDGQTVSQFIRPQIDHAYAHGEMPKLLPHYGD